MLMTRMSEGKHGFVDIVRKKLINIKDKCQKLWVSKELLE